MLKDQDRGKKILAKLEVGKLPFVLNSTNIREFGKDIAQDLNYLFTARFHKVKVVYVYGKKSKSFYSNLSS